MVSLHFHIFEHELRNNQTVVLINMWHVYYLISCFHHLRR